jgi:hypothetical protein
MADNRDLANLSGNAASDEVTYSGDTAVIQVIRQVHVTGAEGAKTVVEIVGSAGSSAAGVLSVQGISSGTALGVSDNGGALTVDDGGSSLTVDGTVTANRTRAATATISTQADAATSATLKASNANRLGIVIVNDSTAVLYVKYGATASATDYTYKLSAGESLREELYTGIIDGIWASDASGSARITELTA